MNRQRCLSIGLWAVVLLCADAQAQPAAPVEPERPQQPTVPAQSPAQPAASAQPGGPDETPSPVQAAAQPQGPELTLEQAIALALDKNEQPKIADQQARAAEARVGRARAAFFPSVTATGNYLFRPDPARRVEMSDEMIRVFEQDQHVFSGVVGLNVNLIDPRAFPLYSQAKLENAAAGLRAEEAKRVIAFDVARAYITALGVEQVQLAAERRLWLAQRIMDGAERRFEAGLSSSNDVTRAQLELATAKRELARSRGDVESARLQLGYLIGLDVNQQLAVPPPQLSAAVLSPGDAGSLSRAALSRRKDLAAADKQAAAADAGADEPTARWFPRLALVGQYRASTETFGGIGKHDELTMGVQLVWDLWDGGARIADREERVAQATAAELEVQAISRRVPVDVRLSLSQLQRGRTEASEAEVAAVAARKNMDETRELYRQGLVQSLSVADAALQLFAAEVELVRARYGIATALLDLRAAAGLDPFGKEPR